MTLFVLLPLGVLCWHEVKIAQRGVRLAANMQTRNQHKTSAKEGMSRTQRNVRRWVPTIHCRPQPKLRRPGSRLCVQFKNQSNDNNPGGEATERNDRSPALTTADRAAPLSYRNAFCVSACLPSLGLVGLLFVQEQVGGLDSCEAFPGLRRREEVFVVSAFHHAIAFQNTAGRIS